MENEIICPHNSSGWIHCTHTDECSRCGWNPNVAKRRLEAYCAQRNIKIPEVRPTPKSDLVWPNKEQRAALKSYGLNADNWFVIREEELGFIVAHKDSGQRRQIRNGGLLK